MINLDRVAEVITESHEEGHLPSQLAVSTPEEEREESRVEGNRDNAG